MRLVGDSKPQRGLFERLGARGRRGGQCQAAKTSREGAAINLHVRVVPARRRRTRMFAPIQWPRQRAAATSVQRRDPGADLGALLVGHGGLIAERHRLGLHRLLQDQRRVLPDCADRSPASRPSAARGSSRASAWRHGTCAVLARSAPAPRRRRPRRRSSMSAGRGDVDRAPSARRSQPARSSRSGANRRPASTRLM